MKLMMSILAILFAISLSLVYFNREKFTMPKWADEDTITSKSMALFCASVNAELGEANSKGGSFKEAIASLNTNGVRLLYIEKNTDGFRQKLFSQGSLRVAQRWDYIGNSYPVLEAKIYLGFLEDEEGNKLKAIGIVGNKCPSYVVWIKYPLKTDAY